LTVDAGDGQVAAHQPAEVATDRAVLDELRRVRERA
jgi:hypothetical protein